MSGVEEVIESFVDDIEIFCSSDTDFTKVDECIDKFEQVSGAILNRSNKSVVLGLGKWKNRDNWPLPWLKTVSEIKVFGILLTPSYSEILQKNWS